jgi:hypothetical protein
VLDAEFVEPGLPLGEFIAVRAAEGEVVQPDPAFVEPITTKEASPRTAEVVLGLAGDVAVGWGQAGGVVLTPLPGGTRWPRAW